MGIKNRGVDLETSKDQPAAEDLLCTTPMFTATRLMARILKAWNPEVPRPPHAALGMPGSPFNVASLNQKTVLDLDAVSELYANTPDAQRLTVRYSIPPDAGLWYVIANAANSAIMDRSVMEEITLDKHSLITDTIDKLSVITDPSWTDIRSMLEFSDDATDVRFGGPGVAADMTGMGLGWVFGIGWMKLLSSPLIRIPADATSTARYALRDSATDQKRLENLVAAARFISKQPSFLAVHVCGYLLTRPSAMRELRYEFTEVELQEFFTRMKRAMAVKLLPCWAYGAALMQPCPHDFPLWKSLPLFPIYNADDSLRTMGASFLKAAKANDVVSHAFPYFGYNTRTGFTGFCDQLKAAASPAALLDALDRPLRRCDKYLDKLKLKGDMQPKLEAALGCIQLPAAPTRYFNSATWSPAFTDGVFATKAMGGLLSSIMSPIAQAHNPDHFGNEEMWAPWRGTEEDWYIHTQDYIDRNDQDTHLSKTTRIFIRQAMGEYERLRTRRKLRPETIRLAKEYLGDVGAVTIQPSVETLAMYLQKEVAAVQAMITSKDPSIQHLLDPKTGGLITDQGDYFYSDRTLDDYYSSIELERDAAPSFIAVERRAKVKGLYSVGMRAERTLSPVTWTTSFAEPLVKECEGIFTAAMSPYVAVRPVQGQSEGPTVKKLEKDIEEEADLTVKKEPSAKGEGKPTNEKDGGGAKADAKSEDKKKEGEEQKKDAPSQSLAEAWRAKTKKAG